MKFFLVILLCNSFLSSEEINVELAPFTNELNLDVLVNGEVIQKSNKDCNARYQLIREVAKKYERPFTVLDLGAGEGYYSFRLAEEFPLATCVMVEKNKGLGDKIADKLLSLCNQNNKLQNIILLDKQLTINDIIKLGEVECFDIVLAMNFISYIRPTKQYLPVDIVNLIQKLGEEVIVELPITNKIYNKIYKENKSTYQIVTIDDAQYTSNLFFLNGKSQSYINQHWFSNADCKSVVVDSSKQRKAITVVLDKAPWVYQFYRYGGITLVTYLTLNGVWPEREFVKEKLSQIDWRYYSNILPWHIRLSGQNIEIEYINFYEGDKNYQERERFCLDILNCKSQKEIADFIITNIP